MSLWPTTGAVLKRSAQLWPQRTAVVAGSTRLTYLDLYQRVLHVTNQLSALGGDRQLRVAVLARNSLELLEAYFAVPAAGHILLPMNWRLSTRELQGQLELAEIDYLVSAGDLPASGSELTGDGPVQDLEWAQLRESPTPARPFKPALAGGFVYCTSGTTGDPKRITLTEENVLCGSLAAAAAVSLGHQPVWLHAGPMFHLADAWAIWAITWAGGTHVVANFDPENAVRLIDAEQVTHTLLVPTALEMLCQAVDASESRTDSLTSVLYGGAALPGRIFEHARTSLAGQLIGTYGATEAAGIITVLDPRDATELTTMERATCVGRETAIFELELMKQGTAVREVGTVGEIVLLSPSLSLTSLRDGRFHSGDLAHRDSSGRLHLVGRSKEMLISGGENIYPAEVERALELHPAVREVVVVGLPDARWGEAVAAVIVKRDGHNLSLASMREFARDHLAGYKLPRAISAVPELPRTPSGKLDRRSLQDSADRLSWERLP